MGAKGSGLMLQGNSAKVDLLPAGFKFGERSPHLVLDLPGLLQTQGQQQAFGGGVLVGAVV